MKVVKVLTLVLTVMITLGLVSPIEVKADSKIAYADLGKMFDEYQKTKDSDAVLEKEAKGKQAERDKMVSGIRKLKDELELLGNKAKEKKQAEIDQKIKTLQEFDREVSAELKQKRDAMVREILKEIDDVIQEYGKKEGYDVIFDERTLFYSKDSMDVTEPILKTLNDRYKRKR